MSVILDDITEVVKPGGRVDALLELKEWLQKQIDQAKAELQRLEGKTYERDTRPASNATN